MVRLEVVGRDVALGELVEVGLVGPDACCPVLAGPDDLGPVAGLDLAEVGTARPRADDGGCLATPDIFCVNSEILRQKRLIYNN